MKGSDATVLALVAMLLGGGLTSAAPPADDDLTPRGMVAFIDADGCPDGWVQATVAAGRMLVATADVDAVGRVVGAALAPEEDRAHDHTLSAAAIELPYKSVTAANGGNDSGAAAGSRPITGTIAPATTGLPFVQLTTCVAP